MPRVYLSHEQINLLNNLVMGESEHLQGEVFAIKEMEHEEESSLLEGYEEKNELIHKLLVKLTKALRQR
jgi:hypothetical protein